MPVHPFLCLQYLILLSTIVTATVFILLLLLLFCYCYYYKTIATDKLLRASLFMGSAKLTTDLLRLINILWLPLCRINKFGFYFPRRLLRSPILVGLHGDGEEPDYHLHRDDSQCRHCLSFLCVPCLATLCTLPNKTCKSRPRLCATCLATCCLCMCGGSRLCATSD
jgi:hypothetical protein